MFKIEQSEAVHAKRKELYDELIEQMKNDYDPSEGYSFEYPSMIDAVPLDFAFDCICEDVKTWAESKGFYIHTEKNKKWDDIYNCHLKRKKHLNTNTCLKVFLESTENFAIIRASKWISDNYRVVCNLSILNEL